MLPASTQIRILEVALVTIEVRGARIVLVQRLPVLLRPLRVTDSHFEDGLLERGVHRNGQPSEALRRLDAIAISPIVLGVLHIVVEHEEVDVGNDVEVSLPGDVVGLNDCDPLWLSDGHRSPPSRDAGISSLGVGSSTYALSASVSFKMSARAPMMQLSAIRTCSRIVELMP